MFRQEFRTTPQGSTKRTAGQCGRRLARWCSTLLVALLLTAGDLGGVQQAQATTFLERAQEYLEEGELKSAEIELKNALQRDPNNAEARFLLGKVLLLQGNAPSAEKELLRARSLGHGDDELELMLAKARLDQRRYDNVVSEISRDLPIESEIQRDLFAARGEALLGQGKFDEAEAVFDRVLSEGPHARALTNKARIAMVLGNSQSARGFLDRALATDPDDALALSVDGEWLYWARQFSEAKARFSRAVQLDPRMLGSHLGLVQTELVLGNLDAAEEIVGRLMAAQPQNVLIVLQDSTVQFLQGNYFAAKRQAEFVLTRISNQRTALFVVGHSAFHLQEYELARARLLPYLAQNPQDSASRAVLGAAVLKLGDVKEAYSIVNAPDVSLPDTADYIKLLAVTAISSGDAQAGLRYLERLAAQSPDDADVQERVGIARADLGDHAGSAAALERAIELEPERLEARARLLAVYLGQEQLAEAEELGQATKERFPDRAAGDTYLGLIHLVRRETDRAEQAFQSALEKEPANAEAALNLANIFVMRDQAAEAREILDGLLEEDPDNVMALTASAELEHRSGNTEKAESLAHKVLAGEPRNSKAQEVLASIYLDSDRAAEAVAITRQVLTENPGNAALLEAAGVSRLRVGDYSGALEVFDHLAELRPRSVRTLEYLLAALEWTGQVPRALEVTERILQLDPQSTVARFGRARYLAQLDRLEEAKAVLHSLQEDYPDRPEVLVVQARIALAEGHSGNAKALAERAFEVSPSNFLLIERVRMTFAAGEREEGFALLRSWLEDHPDDRLIHATLAETLLGTGLLEEAKLAYEDILARSPDDPRHLNNLAWTHIRLGESEEAVPLARKAVSLVPKSLGLLDTLAVALLNSGEKEEALSLLSDAHAAAGGNPTIWFRFALALAENQQPERAQAELEKLLGSVKTFPERQQAEHLLQSLRQG